ncbi:MAG TPA: PQQ-dependent sugar dehydrogenase [Methyloceanibacter sp.]|nr:PQQ-dependent sugar dehydrogenase [Methyloceanibacter sp.]
MSLVPYCASPLLAMGVAVLAFAGSAASARELSLPSGKLSVESLAKLDNPWALAYLPDGRLLITEKPGNLRIYSDGKLSKPITGVPEVEYHDQGGLLDVAIDPNFAENGLVYLSYTEAAEQQPADAREEKDPRLGEYQDLEDTVLKGLAVARGKLDGNRLEGVKVIWRQEPKQIGRGHFGGRLVFAPDGKLFITSGERQRFEPAQDLQTNLGKIVRINPDGSIPEDNPFANQDDARADIWTLGHRNQLGAVIRPDSSELWIHEMGPKGGDELNLIEKGKNYGWPVVSEGVHYNDAEIPNHSERSDFTPPRHAWVPAISPAGLIFYSGDKIKDWKGKAILGGLSSEAIIVVNFEGGKVAGDEIIEMGQRIREVAQAPDGAVMLLVDGKDGGDLLRLAPSDEAEAG